MGRLKTQRESELSADTLRALESTRINGALAPVYLQIANSEPALRAYLAMEAVLRESELSLREIEAIKLLVSQHNRCDYCLSVHTVKAKGAGIDEAEQVAIRKGELLSDTRLNIIVQVATKLLAQPGTLDPELLHRLREEGVNDQQMVSIALAISTIGFTNMFNHLNDSKAPFAPAPAIE